MTSRAWALLSFALALSAMGCSLSRSVIGATGSPDAGNVDTGLGGHDAGPPVDTGVPPTDGGACPASCDDGNPCTDDACDSTDTCTHTNNTASCDDGVLCNGGDTCGGGSCSVHDGVDPCPGMSTCDAASDMCTGCRGDADCPADVPGTFGACDFGGDLCATSGTQTRSVQTFTCNHGTCETGTTSESQSCTRTSTDGNMCAAPAYGDWGPCEYGTDPCTEAGMQTRTTTISQCAGGACVAMDGAESQACMRSTDGDACGMPTTSPWSACMVGATCGMSGMQSRTTMTPTCSGGACMVTTTSESQTCTPSGSTGTLTCGTTTCGSWSACMQTMSGTCDRTGTQTRSCSTPSCVSGACTGTATTTETQACNASVNGNACTTTSCSSCHEPGRWDCRSGHTGTQRCTTTNGTCMDWGLGPFCGGFGGTTSDRTCSC